jgi:hypothetical protein
MHARAHAHVHTEGGVNADERPHALHAGLYARTHGCVRMRRYEADWEPYNPPGVPGPAGLPGDVGHKGPAGDSGRDGKNGTDGKPGPKGFPGDDGVNAPDGVVR